MSLWAVAKALVFVENRGNFVTLDSTGGGLGGCVFIFHGSRSSGSDELPEKAEEPVR